MTAEAFIKDKLIPWIEENFPSGSGIEADELYTIERTWELIMNQTGQDIKEFIERHKTEWQEGGE